MAYLTRTALEAILDGLSSHENIRVALDYYGGYYIQLRYGPIMEDTDNTRCGVKHQDSVQLCTAGRIHETAVALTRKIARWITDHTGAPCDVLIVT